MSETTQENQAPRRGGHIFWNIATVAALAASVALFISARQTADSVAQLDQHTQEQISKLRTDLSQSSEASHQSIESLAVRSQETAAQAAASAEARAKLELRKTGASLTAQLTQQKLQQEQVRQQVAGELTTLKDANTSAESKLGEISGDVSGVKTEIASTQSELHQTGSDLKRVMGDMGVMSGLVATNSTQLNALKELGERDYIQFDLKKGAARQKVGNMQLTLAKADPKRNRFTIQVLADDKTVEKRDRTINEPVQLYLAGHRQPNEIVVNEVKKDEVIGYISVPKVKATRP